MMQAARVASEIVEAGQDLANSVQLNFSRFFTEHPGIGVFSCKGVSVKLLETPHEIKRALMLGEHNEYIYTKLLELTYEEFVRLDAEGVFE